MSPKAWYFIPMDGNSNNEGSQRIVRQNAMRDYRRSERLARVRKHMEGQAEICQRHAGTSEQPGSEHQETFPLKYVDLSREMIRSPRQGFGFIDPFDLTVLPGSLDARLLFSHFVHEIAPKLQPVGSETSRNSINNVFARSALVDRGLLSTILFHAGVHSDSLYGRPWSQSTLYYRGETIRILNEKLESSEDAISDSSVAMVAFLAASGNITGDVEDDQVHFRALQTMISIRGGLKNLGWKGALAMLISLGELIGATILNCQPRLEAPDLTSNPLTSRLPVDLFQRPIEMDEPKSFADELVRCMHTMACLASLQTELLSNPELSMTSVISLTQLSSALEHRLLRSQPPPLLYTSAVLLLYEASRLAQLMCISCIFRDFGASTATLRSLSHRLRQTLISLEPLIQNVTQLSEKRMLAWIVCVGGIASLDQDWYASRLARIMSELRVLSNEEWQALLSDFVWSPRMNNRSYNSLLEFVHCLYNAPV